MKKLEYENYFIIIKMDKMPFNITPKLDSISVNEDYTNFLIS